MEKEDIKWTEERSWEEFRNSGLLWFINRFLHLFGWAIAVEMEEGSEQVIRSFPIRCRYRGFDIDSEERGFKNVTNFLKGNVDDLLKDTEL